MALKRRITADEHAELHEVLQGEYKDAGDGHFVIDAPEWATDRSRVDEFRSNNTALMQERDELRATAEKYKDLDPERAREALDKLQEIEDKKLIDSGDVDKLVEQKVARTREDYEAQLAAKEAEIAKRDEAYSSLEGTYRGVVIDEAIRAEALDPDLGVKRSAIPDIILRAKGVWDLDEDGKTAIAKDGDSILRNEDGNPVSAKEWIGGLRETSPHLFEGSGGGGADGGDRGSRNGTSTVDRSDGDSINRNIEHIASGKVTVGD